MRLRALRTAAGVTGMEAGAALHATGSKISRIESGEVPVRARDVEQLLHLYGEPSPAERDQLLTLARVSTGPGWWDPYSDSVPAAKRHCLEMEAAASAISTCDCTAVPALLQTGGYAAAVTSSLGTGTVREWRAGQSVAILEHRRSLLSSGAAPRLWALIGEAALRRQAGSREVMAEQLRHLTMLAQAPNITVQVVPATASEGLAAAGPFSVLRFPGEDLSDIVFLEALTRFECLERRRDVDRYLLLFNLLATAALDCEASLNYLQTLAATGPTAD
jgi:hypothetical protein